MLAERPEELVPLKRVLPEIVMVEPVNFREGVVIMVEICRRVGESN